MFYYPHHIGDFVAATSRLSDSQSMAYLRLMWLYYETEKPLPDDMETLAFKVGADVSIVRLILQNFFVFDGSLWTHARCDSVLNEYKKKSEKAAASATARWNNARAMRTHSERNANESKIDANQEPITNNQDIEPKGSCQQADRIAHCPQDRIIQLYHDTLPDLPKVRLQSQARSKALRSFWKWVLTSKRSDGNPRAQTADDAIAWIEAYFSRASANDFLMGRMPQSKGHENWRCDLDFLLTEKGKKHVIEKTQDQA